MKNDQEQLSRTYRAWVVGLAQEERLDGVATGLLAAAAGRQAQALHEARQRLQDPKWEEQMMAVMGQHLSVAFHGGPLLDRLLHPILEEATMEFWQGVRAAFAAEINTFGESLPLIQAFLDNVFPVAQTGEQI